MSTVELVLDGITHGGEAVGRLPDGKACFVPYAIPGERVRVEVVEQRKRWARARLVEVLEPSPDRVEAPCPYFGPGRCGGCQLQHIDPAAQAALKRRILVEQLQRIGRIPDPPVGETVRVADFGYRNRARFGVDTGGRLGFRRAGSHDLVPIDRCLLVAPEVQALRDVAGDAWTGVEEIEVRAAGPERALVIWPGSRALPALPPGEVPVAVVDVRGRAVALRGEPTLGVEVEGVGHFRVSPTSFFQASVGGAAVLARLVRDAAEVRIGDTALDLHAGVGLFASVLSGAGASVTAVEAHAVAAEDARANLGEAVEVIAEDAESYVARRAAEGRFADVVVLDPPRRGAGAVLCRSLAALDPRVVVYVSCDPAALARDVAVLAEEGYRLDRAVPVDVFAQTAQIETVATFTPAAG
jgi:23S rRNA (uracil1939-C5)-methyltransferase